MKLTVPLRGAGGEPVDLWRTIQSHGLTELPPMRVLAEERALEVTIPMHRSRPRTIVLRRGRGKTAQIDVKGRLSDAAGREIVERVRYMLRLDDDLSAFYRVATGDEALAWAAAGAGRMLRGSTVFEDVVKTICTTNCSWGLTTKMISMLVQHLGEPAAGAPPDSPLGRAFPTPQAMAAVDERFYTDVVRAGYRARYFKELARLVASGEVDLERFATTPRDELSEVELELELIALPGVGPYAAAHIMMLLGRHSRLVLDSWTRPKFARLTGKKKVTDAAIQKRWKSYGDFAGLAFWLFLTRDWVEDA